MVEKEIIMAEAKKDRRADEFLELWPAMQKRKDVQALQNLKELWTAVPDVAYDVHAVSSKCENMTVAFMVGRLMLALCKKKSGTQYTDVLTLEGEKK